MKRAAILGILVLLHPPHIGAQSLGIGADRDLPSWHAAWSPLSTRADLPQRLPGAGTGLPRLLLPAPRGGLFWLAGNPAALGRLGPSRSDFVAAVARQDGDYRRPLDPAASRLIRVDGRAQRDVSPRVSMVGHVVIDRERLSPGTESNFAEPYPSSPFVTTDSSVEALDRTRVRLEGAAGWTIGQWRLGGTLGYQSWETNTVEAALVRRSRQTMPGAVLGVLRQVGRVALGVHLRYRERAETIRLNELAREGLVGELDGLGDTKSFGFQQSYYKRREDVAQGVGAGVSWEAAGAEWALFAELDRIQERLWIQEANDPPKDRWDADARSAGFRFVGLRSGRLAMAGEARYTSLSGNADLPQDTLGIYFSGKQSLLTAEVEVRLAPATDGWQAALAITEERQTLDRRDIRNGVYWKVGAWAPAASLEIGRALGKGGTFVVGGAIGRYGPTSEIPRPERRSALFRRLLAPEMDLTARVARSASGFAGFKYRAGGNTSLWWLGRIESLKPADQLGPLPAFSATGSRSAWSIVMGVTLEPKGT
jgi:hypothetical protein